MKEKKYSIENLDLFYMDNEKEGMTVVMIHGNSLSSQLFYRQFESTELSKFRLIAPDLPGHGKSSKSRNPENDYAVSTYIKNIIEFIQSLKSDTCVLFGHSLGGHIAIHVAQHVASVKGLIIMGAPPLTAPPKLEKAFLPNPAMPLAFKPDLSENDLELLASSYISEKHPDFNLMKCTLSSSDPLVRPFIGKSISTEVNEDEANIIKNADFSVAILHGEHDGLVNSSYIDDLQLNLWKNEIIMIEDAGHSAFLENPERFNHFVADFLADVQHT